MPLLPTFERTLKLTNDRLCLDFVNTVGNHASAEPTEGLTNYADLVTWAERAGVLPAEAAERLRAEAQRQPETAEAVSAQAVELREVIYRLLLAHQRGEGAGPDDLLRLNTHLGDALAHAQLTPAEDGYGLHWDLAGSTALAGPLWPVAYSAADLLATPEQLERVGQCQDDRGCGWLFLDLTKNHSRRWCAMDDCGNRAKAKRHYERKKSAV